MKPIITLLSLLYLFLFFVILFLTGQSQPYTPVDNITLACGNSGQPTSNDLLRTWTGDVNSKFTPIGSASESITAVIHTEELKQASLAEWAKSCHQNGELDQIIDASLRGKITAECLNKFTEIAISCMNENGTERPSMTAVVSELEHALQLQQSAEGKSKCPGRNVETETSCSQQNCATNDSIKCISVTIFYEINESVFSAPGCAAHPSIFAVHLTRTFDFFKMDGGDGRMRCIIFGDKQPKWEMMSIISNK